MNFNELFQKMRELDAPVADEGIMDTVGGWAKQAGQAVANTTLGDVGNAVKNYSLPGMAASAVKGAANAVRGAVAPAGQAAKPAMAPVKPADAFGGAPATPAAEFGDLPPQSTAGAGRGSINPPMAGQAPATPAKPAVAAKPAAPVSGASIIGAEKAFSEEYNNIDVEECGLPGMSSMPSGMAGMTKQQDNVTMNISMNGSGSGGIRDLMNILRDLEDGPGDGGNGMDDEMGVIIDKMASDDGDREMPLIGMDEAEAGGFDQASTTPDETYQDTEYMTKDLAGGINGPKTMYKHSYRQGDNPMAMETLTNRLSNLYQEVKSR